MLLGVAWHAGPWFGSGPVPAFMEWLHSFRMPMFMFISGFFSCMMLAKHGIYRYFTRRWLRIGIPMLIGLFTFMPIYNLYGPTARMSPGSRPARPGRANSTERRWRDAPAFARGGTPFVCAIRREQRWLT